MDVLDFKFIVSYWEDGEYNVVKFKKYKKANKFFIQKSTCLNGVCFEKVKTKLLKCT